MFNHSCIKWKMKKKNEDKLKNLKCWHIRLAQRLINIEFIYMHDMLNYYRNIRSIRETENFRTFYRNEIHLKLIRCEKVYLQFVFQVKNLIFSLFHLLSSLTLNIFNVHKIKRLSIYKDRSLKFAIIRKQMQ